MIFYIPMLCAFKRFHRVILEMFLKFNFLVLPVNIGSYGFLFPLSSQNPSSACISSLIFCLYILQQDITSCLDSKHQRKKWFRSLITQVTQHYRVACLGLRITTIPSTIKPKINNALVKRFRRNDILAQKPIVMVKT